MRVITPPVPSDVRLEIVDERRWRLSCPARFRRHFVLQGAAGVVAGAVLGTVSVGGLLEALGHPSWGAQLFMVSWLGPLALIAFLLFWLGVKTIARIWQTNVLESDGNLIRHLTEAPWGARLLFETPASNLEPFRVPSSHEMRHHTDAVALSARTGPLELQYRTDRGKGVRSHECMTGLRHDELVWIASSLNPLLMNART